MQAGRVVRRTLLHNESLWPMCFMPRAEEMLYIFCSEILTRRCAETGDANAAILGPGARRCPRSIQLKVSYVLLLCGGFTVLVGYERK